MCITDTIYYYIVSMRKEYSDLVKTFGIMFSRNKKKNFQILINCNLWEVHKLSINNSTIHDKD